MEKNQSVGWYFRPVVIIIILFLALFAGIYYYSTQELKNLDSRVNQELEAIAFLKISQIVQWRNTLYTDADLILSNVPLTSRIKQFIMKKKKDDKAEDILSWIKMMTFKKNYSKITIYDAAKISRLSFIGTDLKVKHGLNLSDNPDKIFMTELHRADTTELPHMEIIIPIIDHTVNPSKILGYMELQIDPRKYLYPLMEIWPTAGKTAETLILTVQDNHILYLNELRNSKNSALNLKLPIKDYPNLPAVMAATGLTGVVRGTDYRGKKVLAYISKIPDSNWFMVAKEDLDEIHAPQRKLWINFIIGICLLGIGAILTLYFSIRYEKALQYKRQLALEIEKQQISRKYEHITKYANDIFILTKPDLNIIDANNKALETYGYSFEELIKLKLTDLENDNISIDNSLNNKISEVFSLGSVFESVHKTKSGTLVNVEVSAQVLEFGGAKQLFFVIRDTTERKKTADELYVNEALLKESQKLANIGHYSLDISTGIWHSSDALNEVFGIDWNYKTDIVGWVSLIYPDDQEMMNTYFMNEVLGKKTPFDKEYRILRVSDQQTRWVHGLGRLDYDSTGNPIRMFGNIQDITDRKLADEALRESENKFRKLYEDGPLGMAIVNNQFTFMMANNTFCNMTGYTESELQNLTFREITHPENAERDTENVKKLMMGEFPVYKTEKRYIRKDQSLVWSSSTITVNYSNDGKFLYFVVMVEDINERKIAEEAIKVSETKFRGLFENAITGIALHEIELDENSKPVDYIFLDANKSFGKLTGLDVGSIIGKKVTDVIPGIENSDFIEKYGNVALTGESIQFEDYAEALDKHYMINAFRYAPLKFAVSFLDITDRIRREEELRQKNEELARFIYTVSHDLKSPLVTIKSFLGFLIQDMKDNDQTTVERDLAFIKNAADKMGNLLDELLQLSRIGRVSTPQKEILLQDVVKSAFDLVAGRIAEKKVDVRVTNEPIILFGDAQRLVELFQNLIDNSCKFMGDQVSPVIEIGAEITGDDILLFVKDNGIGIDNRYLKKLFGLFEKIEVNAEGSGMGLAIVKRIVEVHGGEIFALSDGLGKGTTFKFTLLKTHLKNF